MQRHGVRLVLVTLLAAALSGCTVLAVGGAVVTVASVAVKGGVAVGKGAVAVATYPFRDSEEEKQRKAAEEAERDKKD